MHDHVCIGGFDMAGRKNIRLLNLDGMPPPSSIPFQIGDVWRISYNPLHRSLITAPHVEDATVSHYTRAHHLGPNELVDFIYSNCTVIKGPITALFGGHVVVGGSACIEASAVPDHSVCFWQTETPLQRCRSYDKDKYLYEEGDTRFWLTYVGTDPPVERIEAPGLVRVSLARWWAPPGSLSAKRCFLQMSGWY